MDPMSKVAANKKSSALAINRCLDQPKYEESYIKLIYPDQVNCFRTGIWNNIRKISRLDLIRDVKLVKAYAAVKSKKETESHGKFNKNSHLNK